VDVSREEFLEYLDQALDPLEVVVVEVSVLGREDVGKVDHVDSHPVLFLLAGAAQLGQKGRVILLHLYDVRVEVVGVGVSATELVDVDVRWFPWCRRRLGDASEKRFDVSFTLVLMPNGAPADISILNCTHAVVHRRENVRLVFA
jgi:hypothetical protein